MKKAKIDNRRAEKQKKGKIREEKSPDDSQNLAIQKMKNKTTKDKLSNGASYGAEAGYAAPLSAPMDKISLGNKRPFGITRGPDDTMYVTEMLHGGVKKVNVLTGMVEQVVPSYLFLERGARGIALEHEHLFVAGGGVPDGTPLMVYVYDESSGTEVAACAPEGDDWYLLNDIAILGDFAYVTDSKYSKLFVLDVAAALKGACKVFSIKTPSYYFLQDSMEKKSCSSGERCPAYIVVVLHRCLRFQVLTTLYRLIL
jgi:hypothetical protein